MSKEPRVTIDHCEVEAINPPKIVTSYSGYTPPFDVEALVSRMLASVPSKYLNGLSEVVLTNSSGLSRKRRRSVTKARGRKVQIVEAGGLYHPAWQGSTPWIELFVDNILKRWQSGIWLKLGFFRESLIGDVLFHEIGHHIHATVQPEHRDKEDVADFWKVRLERIYARSRHKWLRTFLYPLRPLIHILMNRADKRMLDLGMISGAEFSERMKRNQR